MFTVDCAQVGYSEQSSDYTLYLVAGEHAERLHWIHIIRSGEYSLPGKLSPYTLRLS